jgi:uncharacterized membrane protein YhaH (DUF805 family)
MDVDFASLLFGFQGRINRAKYWMALVVYSSVSIAIVGMGFYLQFSVLFFVTLPILILLMAISGIAVGIKRLHDRDKTGWWLVPFYLLPPLFDGLTRINGLSLLFGLASAAVSIWMIVELGFLRGTPGPNQYGHDPLERRPQNEKPGASRAF